MRWSPNLWNYWAVLLVIWLLPSLLTGMEPTIYCGANSGEEAVRSDPAKAQAGPGAMTVEQKRRTVAVTSMIIAGILGVALLLLLWIAWWSRRTHRLLREPLPAASRGDELWYLKGKRPPSTKSEANPNPSEAPPE